MRFIKVRVFVLRPNFTKSVKTSIIEVSTLKANNSSGDRFITQRPEQHSDTYLARIATVEPTIKNGRLFGEVKVQMATWWNWLTRLPFTQEIPSSSLGVVTNNADIALVSWLVS